MEDFTRVDEIEQEEYVLLGKDLATLIVQPAFVEGIVPDRKRFKTIPDAFRFIFRNNREYGIILWNGIPVRFSYTEDLPLMIESLIAMLENRSSGEPLRWITPNFGLEWRVAVRADGQIRIQQQCSRIAGGYEQALSRLGMIILPETTFLNEWKLLLNQLVEAFHRSEVLLDTVEGNALIGRLKVLNETVRGPGALYHY